jgi:hypothetical protein
LELSMDRRNLILLGVGLAAGAATERAFAQGPAASPNVTPSQQPAPPPPQGTPTMPEPAPTIRPNYAATPQADTYSKNEIVGAASDFLGVGAEAVGAAIEKVFADNGRPTGYIAGQEGAAAWILGLRYGNGQLYMKNRQPEHVYWRGPSVGFDLRANASRVFTLCYNLQFPESIFQRFPGVEGSAYFIGGLGVNYQKANGIVLAPVRAGVGLGAGANIGYLAYARNSSWVPF